MPLYPAFLATIYQPAWTDPQFFEVAKTASIYLSLGLVAVIAVAALRRLPPLAALNFVGIVAFGYFVFKAGYTQSEPLFYTLHLLTFIASWQMFVARRTARRIGYAGAAGLLAAFAFLAKAANLPFAALVVAVGAGQALIGWHETVGLAPHFVRPRRRSSSALCFSWSLLYLRTDTLHGQDFYNLNTAVLMWHDDYPQGAAAILSYGPNGWPPGPRSMRPSARRCWRAHSVSQIAAGCQGFSDMVVVLFRGDMVAGPVVRIWQQRSARHDAAPSRCSPGAAGHRARCVSDRLCGPHLRRSPSTSRSPYGHGAISPCASAPCLFAVSML